VERPSHHRLLARQSLVQFASEHTSVNSQGYLNGAVETGQRAAQELLSA